MHESEQGALNVPFVLTVPASAPWWSWLITFEYNYHTSSHEDHRDIKKWCIGPADVTMKRVWDLAK